MFYIFFLLSKTEQYAGEMLSKCSFILILKSFLHVSVFLDWSEDTNSHLRKLPISISS